MKKIIILIGILFVFVMGVVLGPRIPGIIGVEETTNESTIVERVENIGEVALVQLGIVDIFDEERNTELFNEWSLPGSTRKQYLRVEFDAKMGINGNEITINPGDDNSYEIQIPQFIFIGHDNFKSEVAAEDNGILSWTTPEIKQTEIINEILGEENEQEFLKKYESQLKASAELFFTQLIRGIEPDAKISFTYQTPAS